MYYPRGTGMQHRYGTCKGETKLPRDMNSEILPGRAAEAMTVRWEAGKR